MEEASVKYAEGAHDKISRVKKQGKASISASTFHNNFYQNKMAAQKLYWLPLMINKQRLYKVNSYFHYQYSL